MAAPSWAPAQYLAFKDERTRPFDELLRAIPDAPEAARLVVDLGCGPGHLMPMLRERFPAARLVGVDSSPEMVRAARRATAKLPGLEVVHATVPGWVPTDPVDVVVSNALLQWVPGHMDMLATFSSWLTPDGVLAIQVPGNFTEPSHVVARKLAASARWAPVLGDVAWPAAPGPIEYLEALAPLFERVDTWETTYSMVLQGAVPVVEWAKGTTLRPVLSALSPVEADEFLAEYAAEMASAYPPRPWGTVLPFRRVFAVGAGPRSV